MSTDPDSRSGRDAAPTTPVQSPPGDRAQTGPPVDTDHRHGDHRHGDRKHGGRQGRRAERRERQHERKDVLDRQQESFGGIKWGAAFFGWLTALGTLVLLTAIGSGVGAALGLGGTQTQDPGAVQTAGIIVAIVALVVLLVAYYCGGYVAGRMARFNGAKQGVAVWVWTLVITVLAAIVGAIAGSRFDALGNLGGLPQIPLDPAALTIGAIVGVLTAVVVSLVGAILGGLAGMRFHRRIDRAEPSHRPATP